MMNEEEDYQRRPHHHHHQQQQYHVHQHAPQPHYQVTSDSYHHSRSSSNSRGNEYRQSQSRTPSPHRPDHQYTHQAPVHVSHHRMNQQARPEGPVVVPQPRILRNISQDGVSVMTDHSGMSHTSGLSRVPRRHSRGLRGRTLSSVSDGSASGGQPTELDDSADIFDNEGSATRHTGTSQTYGRRTPPRNPTPPRHHSYESQEYDYNPRNNDARRQTPPRTHTPPFTSTPNDDSHQRSPGRRTPPRTNTPPRLSGTGTGMDDSEDAFENEGLSVPPQTRLYPSVSMDDSSTRIGLTSTNVPTGNHQRRPLVPGAQPSTDNTVYARKAGLHARHNLSVNNNDRDDRSVTSSLSRFDPAMDSSSVSQASVPGATFSTDGGIFARKAGLRGRSNRTYGMRSGSGRSLGSAGSGYMEDESNTSIPGAIHETESASSPSASKVKMGLHIARGQDSLKLVDGNIQQRQQSQRDNNNNSFSSQTLPGAVAATGSSWRISKEKFNSSTPLIDGDRFRYQPGASMSSVADERYQNKVQNQEDRMNASLQAVDGMISTRTGLGSSFSGTNEIEDMEARYRAKMTGGSHSTPGVYQESSNQATSEQDAIRAKLDQHFGPEPAEQEREGDFSHVRMLQPRRFNETTTTIGNGTSSVQLTTVDRIGTAMEQVASEQFEQEIDDTEDTAAARRSVGDVPRELMVDADVEYAREQAVPKQKKDRLWFFTKTGMLVGFVLFGTVLACILALVVFKGDGESTASTDLTDDTLGDMTFEESLSASTASILAEQDPDSPQYMAMQWLQEEELFLSSPVWRQRQRFGLVTVYFALYHDDEQQAMPWFQKEVEECTWLWNPDDESVCDNDGRYLRLSLRLDSRTKNDVNLPDFYGIAGGNSTTSHNAPPLANTRPLVMPLEISMVKMQRLVLSHIPGTAKLEDMWPKELLSMDDLNQLEITYSHDIGGTIPTEIGLATSLSFLYIEGSSVTGTIPSQIGLLHQLKELNIIESSQLVGTIPTQVGTMSDLSLLWIFDNPNVTGTIPTQVGMLEDLGFLSFRTNQLYGTVPSELGKCTKLNEFRLGDNRLTGTLPSELGRLREMRIFDIADNEELGGSIPVGLCALFVEQIKYVVDCDKVECCQGHRPS